MAEGSGIQSWISQIGGRGACEDEEKKKPQTVAERNATDWKKPGGGYDQFKTGDAQRAKDLPIGGIAPRRMVETMKERKPMKSWPSRS